MVERYISLYSTQGELLTKARTELKDSDAKLKAKLYLQLPADKQNGVDLSGVDFTGHTIKNCRNCWFDNAILTGAVLMNPAGSTFRDATLIGAKFFGDCRDLYLDRAYMMGVDCSEAFGILVGGYSVKGDPVIANMRAKGWWIHTVNNSVPYYFAFGETVAVTYAIADPVFSARLTEMLGSMRERMTSEMQEINQRFGNANNGAAAAARTANEAEDITKTLASFMQTRSQESMQGVPQLKAENAGDVLNQ